MNTNKKIAVVLFQLGGPDSLESVEPFLYNLFCDPDIIDFPGAFLARKFLARKISRERAPIAAHHYKEIGGKSPILELTNAQALALQTELDKHIQAKVFVAMRYWHPFTKEVIAELKNEKFDKIILLPLYPQYSKTTTGSSINEWNRQSKRLGYNGIPTETILHHYNHPWYIEAIVENINSVLTHISNLSPAEGRQESQILVFSAHGVPVSVIKSGDPYQEHIEETVRLVVEKGNWNLPHVLCYQSKVGPAKWLKPSLDDTIHDLAKQEKKNLLIIPIAFVTEHIETLHEINIETRAEAEELGIEQFEMMPALNSSSKFIRCLTELVLERI